MSKLIYSACFEVTNNFNLYPFEDVDFNNSKENILYNFKRIYEDKIKDALKAIGLKYSSLGYYSPKYYNFEGDNLELTIKVINKKQFKRAILKYSQEAQENLNKNKSYDGFISLSVSSINEELNNLNKINYEPDIVVLFTILNNLINFKSFNVYEYLVFEGVDA